MNLDSHAPCPNLSYVLLPSLAINEDSTHLTSPHLPFALLMARPRLSPTSVSFRLRLVSPITRLLLLITLIFTSNSRDYVLSLPREKPLCFSKESAFKIALFADLHYGENAWTDWGPAQDVNSDRVMSTVLDQETPGIASLHQSIL